MYKTRHLQALVPMQVGDRLVQRDETFHATDVDADYYIGKNKAVAAPDEHFSDVPTVGEAAWDSHEQFDGDEQEREAEATPAAKKVAAKRTYTRRAVK